MVGDVRWPLGSVQQELVAELATLIARGGAWRFLRAAVVAGDVSHYPDPWHASREGVARVVGRTLWHAYMTVDATVEDVRMPADSGRRLLRDTQIELADVSASSVLFALQALGNDDVAGAVSHEVGSAYVGWLARNGHPFRTVEDGLPDPALGSLATVYLGLGVVAANAAFYSRSGGHLIAQSAYHEHQVVRRGGLDVEDLAFLLAVQATVRDDVLPALDTLRPTQAELVAAWREVLDDHEDELRHMLGVVEPVDLDTAPTRPEAPPPVVSRGEIEERHLDKANHGRRVFRFREVRRGLGAPVGAMLGLFGGGVLVAIAVAIAPSLLPIPARAGLVIAAGVVCAAWGSVRAGGKREYWRCASCRGFVTELDEECKTCGGRIVGPIANPNDRLDREEELEQAERAALDRAAASSTAEAANDDSAEGTP
jgi:hypothetical protein